MPPLTCRGVFFFFNDTATTEIYTLSLHDALPILSRHGAVGPYEGPVGARRRRRRRRVRGLGGRRSRVSDFRRSEEHTSELQSQSNLVCRLLLEKKKSYKSGTSCSHDV